MADYCIYCGQPVEQEPFPLEWNGLKIELNKISFNGKSVTMRPKSIEFMRILMHRGRASREYLIMRLSPDCNTNLMDVYACKLRKCIKELTAGRIEIKSIWGWGFELVLNQVPS